MTEDESLDEFWRSVCPRLRRAMRLHELTLEEAECELAAAEPISMSDEEIERIVERATRRADS